MPTTETDIEYIHEDLKHLAVDIDSVHLDPKNARQHDENNVSAIKGSLVEYGFRSPIVVRKGTRIIEAGNGRVMAARELGWTMVPAIVCDDSDAAAIAYAITDNRTAELAGWDEKVLSELLDAVDADSDDLNSMFEDMKKEFTKGSLEEIGEPPDAKVDEAKSLLKKWQPEKGQLWRIESKTIDGYHYLMCGDNQNEEDISILISDIPPTIIVTSPPYNAGIDTLGDSAKTMNDNKKGTGYNTWGARVQELAYEDGMDEGDYQKQQCALLSILYDVLANDGSLFYNHKHRYRDREVVTPMDWVRDPFILRQEIIWHRSWTIARNTRSCVSCDERIYWLIKSGKEFKFNHDIGSALGTVWKMDMGNIDAGSNLHPVSFTIEIPSRCIQLASHVGDYGYDPHAGSSTTALASEKLQRLSYGMEISPMFMSISLERFVDAGMEPELIK